MANRSRHTDGAALRVPAARAPHRRMPRTAEEPRPAFAYADAAQTVSRLERRRAARRRMRGRRLRAAVLMLFLAAAGLVGLDLVRDRPRPAGEPRDAAATTSIDAARPVPSPATAAPAPPPVAPPSAKALPSTTPASPTPSAASTTTGASTVPATGTRAFSYAAGSGSVLGTAGPVRRFRVAVEEGMGLDTAGFAAVTERILGDPRSWVAGGDLRFQRVQRTGEADFTLYLASPGTSERMCAVGGLDTDGYTSCRLPGQVIINARRWTEAVPNYGAPLDDYQAYAINHEVGHQLGHGHENCPSPGAPAPVMQQQTLGLRGCVANSWPYVDAQRYTGPAVP